MKEKDFTELHEVLNKILICFYVVIALLALNTIVVIVKNSSSEPKAAETSGTEEIDEYAEAVSKMQTATVDEVLEMFKNKEKKVLYFGRSNCGACISFIPTLQKAQEDRGYKTVYIDINTVDSTQDNFKELQKKLDIKTTINENGKDVTDTFGNFYGYTPTIIVIDNGKMQGGIIGADEQGLYDLLDANNIKK